MVPSTKTEVSSLRASALAALAALVASLALLPGCNGHDVEKVIEAFALILIVIVVVNIVVWGAMVVVLVMNLVHLGRGKPSVGWGATAIGMGALTGLPMCVSLVQSFHAPTLGGVLLAAGFCFLGYKNIKGARDLAQWRKLGGDDEPTAGT